MPSPKITPALLYALALSFLIAAACIAPPSDPYNKVGVDLVFCTALAEQMPCEEAPVQWVHLCKASVSVSCAGVTQVIQLSRHLPHHLVTVLQSVSLSGTEIATSMVHCMGLLLGLGMMMLGRLLYTPCLCYLPAIVLGSMLVQPLQGHLKSEIGLGPAAVCGAGAALGLLVAVSQRHFVVWLLGLLVGISAFLVVLLGTTLLSGLHFHLVLVVGILSAMGGSILIGYLERTPVWKVVASALVGSIIFTDSMGLGRLNTYLQGLVCVLLVALSTWRQLRPRPRSDRCPPNALQSTASFGAKISSAKQNGEVAHTLEKGMSSAGDDERAGAKKRKWFFGWCSAAGWACLRGGWRLTAGAVCGIWKMARGGGSAGETLKSKVE